MKQEKSELEAWIGRLEGPKAKQIQYYAVERVRKIICEFWGITPEELKSKSRKKEVVAARDHFMYILRLKWSKRPLAMIGKLVNRDHATVLHAINKIQSNVFEIKYKNDVELYNELIKTIEKRTPEEMKELCS